MEPILENKLLAELKKLQDQIAALTIKPKADISIQYGGIDGTRDLKDLFGALAKAQGEMEVATKDQNNPFYNSKYANLTSVIKASRPYLSKFGLSILQPPIYLQNGEQILQTVLAHASGQWVDCRMKILAGNQEVQKLKSHITYLKRISVESLIGIVTAEDDDDGEAAVREVRMKAAKEEKDYKPSQEIYSTITPEQIDEFQYEVKDWPQLAADFLEKKGLQSFGAIKKSDYHSTLERIRLIKAEYIKAGVEKY